MCLPILFLVRLRTYRPSEIIDFLFCNITASFDYAMERLKIRFLAIVSDILIDTAPVLPTQAAVVDEVAENVGGTRVPDRHFTVWFRKVWVGAGYCRQ